MGRFLFMLGNPIRRGLEYVMPVVFSFLLVSLDNIQDHLENPFDQIGEDDVKFSSERFADRLK